jgi:hypothetical protein
MVFEAFLKIFIRLSQKIYILLYTVKYFPTIKLTLLLTLCLYELLSASCIIFTATVMVTHQFPLHSLGQPLLLISNDETQS